MNESGSCCTFSPTLGVWSVVILDILVGVLCYLIAILISISLVTNDTEHPFMVVTYQLYIFGIVSVQIICPFFMRLFGFLLLSFERSLCSLDTSPLLDM